MVSNVLANRLKILLADIISPAQSAFVPGRLISDNIIVAYEALHSMKYRVKGKKEGYMALKLDMSKAYDRIEWCFLEAVLRKLGFGERWIGLVMQCVQTVKYSLIINGEPQSQFQPSRGLRQGDPLSPYLFILCSEVLGNLLDKAEAKGLISGFPFARGALLVNHLFFADDSLIFCKANALEWWRLSHFLKLYEQASGQRLNMDKTSIYFSKNTRQEIKTTVLHAANVKEAKSFEKYLGLPAYVGRNKVSAFKQVLDSIRSRMNSWTVKFISQAGKEVLLKAIIQAIPTYCMSIFKLPRTILQAMNRLAKNFWWGSRGERTKTQWLPWDMLGKSKDDGGLGFRDFEIFNVALLAKQGWRLTQNPDSLAARVLKSKYYSRSDYLNSKIGSNASFLWRSFSEAKKVLREGALWRIGNGESVVIGQDIWIPQASTSQIHPPLHDLFLKARVCELINADSKTWNLQLLSVVFYEAEASIIRKIPISVNGSPDKLIWRGTKDGTFTVKSAYLLMNQMQQDAMGQCSTSESHKEVWRKIWNLNAPNASKMLLWRASHDSLPTNLNLFRRKIRESPFCPICECEDESALHALWSCLSAQDVWSLGPRRLQKISFVPRHFFDLVSFLFNMLPEEEMEVFTCTTYLVWKRRNSFVFENYFEGPAVISKAASQNALAFREVNSQPVCETTLAL